MHAKVLNNSTINTGFAGISFDCRFDSAVDERT